MVKNARTIISKARYLEVMLSLRQDDAINSLSGFVRYMWGVCEGIDDDGLDDVRRKMGILEEVIDPYSGAVRETAGKTLKWNWHLSVICKELEALARGYTLDEDGNPGQPVEELVICVPPGHLKSRLCSVFFPAWLWLHNPGWRLLCVANAADLVTRDSEFMRVLIRSDRYQNLQRRMAFVRGMSVKVEREDGKPPVTTVTDPSGVDVTEEHVWGLDKSQYEKTNFKNTRGGKRLSVSIWSRITGKRCDGIITDDPIDSRFARDGSPSAVAERVQASNEIYTADLSTRRAPGGWRLVIMQRLHHLDLAGQLLAKTLEPGSRTRCVVLPGRFNPEHPHIHPDDPRTEAGTLLCPKYFNERHDLEAQKELRSHYAAQYGQLPKMGAGGMFQRSWFQQRYTVAPWQVLSLAKFSQVAISVDCAFKKGLKTDFVVLQVWAKLDAYGIKGRPKAIGLKPGFYLLDQICERMSFTETVKALKLLRIKWQQVSLVLVEDKANGSAVIDILREEGHAGVVGYSPKASKEARAEISALAFESGQVWLPKDEYAGWIEALIDEHESFPGGANDDQVDAASQMLIRWSCAETTSTESIANELGFLGALTGF